MRPNLKAFIITRNGRCGIVTNHDQLDMNGFIVDIVDFVAPDGKVWWTSLEQIEFAS